MHCACGDAFWVASSAPPRTEGAGEQQRASQYLLPTDGLLVYNLPLVSAVHHSDSVFLVNRTPYKVIIIYWLFSLYCRFQSHRLFLLCPAVCSLSSPFSVLPSPTSSPLVATGLFSGSLCSLGCAPRVRYTWQFCVPRSHGSSVYPGRVAALCTQLTG